MSDDYLHATFEQVKEAHRQLSSYSRMERFKPDYGVDLALVRKDGSIPEKTTSFSTTYYGQIENTAIRNCLSVKGIYVQFIDDSGLIFDLNDSGITRGVAQYQELINRLSPAELALKSAKKTYREKVEQTGWQTAPLERAVVVFNISDFSPATAFSQVKIKRIVDLGINSTILETKIEGDKLLVYFSSRASSSSEGGYNGNYSVYDGEIAIYYSIVSTLALDSQGNEYDCAFFNDGGGYKRLPDSCFSLREGVRG